MGDGPRFQRRRAFLAGRFFAAFFLGAAFRVFAFTAFAIRLPVVPLHLWMADAHAEASPPVSMILNGVVLKIGGYGLLRICLTASGICG